jgi:hypothetical protein
MLLKRQMPHPHLTYVSLSLSLSLSGDAYLTYAEMSKVERTRKLLFQLTSTLPLCESLA